MKIWTLGTSSAVPTKKRNLPAHLINFKGERILFDCGENVQKTLMSEKLGIMKIDRIFITHWHADHFSGLLGLIQTMEMEGRNRPLYIYGPPRTEEFTHKILDTGYFNRSYDIFVEELEENEIIVGDGYEVKPFEVEHGVPAYGYTFKEKPQKKANKQKMKELGLESSPKIGKLKKGEAIEWEGERIEPEEVIEEVPGRKVVYSGDTSKCQNLINNSKGADLLIHEATCLHELIEEREHHSSALQAAEIAKEADVEKLLITHISRRYKGDKAEELEEEAKTVFANSELATDGKSYSISPHRPE